MGEDENTNDEICVDAGVNFEVLNLSAYDPVVDIVIVNVNIGKMPISRVHAYMKKMKNDLTPMFEKCGFDVIYNPVREPSIGAASMDVQSKEINARRDLESEMAQALSAEIVQEEPLSTEDSKDAFDQARIIID